MSIVLIIAIIIVMLIVAILFLQGKKQHQASIDHMIGADQGQGNDHEQDLFLTRLTIGPGDDLHHERLTGLSKTWNELGFSPWTRHQVLGMNMTVDVADNQQCAVAVYTHPLIGQWFELWSDNGHIHVWSNSPLFDNNLVWPGVNYAHHKMMMVHQALHEAQEQQDQHHASRTQPMLRDRVVEEIVKLHDKNIWHYLSSQRHGIERTKIDRWLMRFWRESEKPKTDDEVAIVLPSDQEWNNTNRQVIYRGEHPTTFSVVLSAAREGQNI